MAVAPDISSGMDAPPPQPPSRPKLEVVRREDVLQTPEQDSKSLKNEQISRIVQKGLTPEQEEQLAKVSARERARTIRQGNYKEGDEIVMSADQEWARGLAPEVATREATVQRYRQQAEEAQGRWIMSGRSINNEPDRQEWHNYEAKAQAAEAELNALRGVFREAGIQPEPHQMTATERAKGTVGGAVRSVAEAPGKGLTAAGEFAGKTFVAGRDLAETGAWAGAQLKEVLGSAVAQGRSEIKLALSRALLGGRKGIKVGTGAIAGGVAAVGKGSVELGRSAVDVVSSGIKWTGRETAAVTARSNESVDALVAAVSENDTLGQGVAGILASEGTETRLPTEAMRGVGRRGAEAAKRFNSFMRKTLGPDAQQIDPSKFTSEGTLVDAGQGGSRVGERVRELFKRAARPTDVGNTEMYTSEGTLKPEFQNQGSVQVREHLNAAREKVAGFPTRIMDAAIGKFVELQAGKLSDAERQMFVGLVKARGVRGIARDLFEMKGELAGGVYQAAGTEALTAFNRVKESRRAQVVIGGSIGTAALTILAARNPEVFGHLAAALPKIAGEGASSALNLGSNVGEGLSHAGTTVAGEVAAHIPHVGDAAGAVPSPGEVGDVLAHGPDAVRNAADAATQAPNVAPEVISNAPHPGDVISGAADIASNAATGLESVPGHVASSYDQLMNTMVNAKPGDTLEQLIADHFGSGWINPETGVSQGQVLGNMVSDSIRHVGGNPDLLLAGHSGNLIDFVPEQYRGIVADMGNTHSWNEGQEVMQRFAEAMAQPPPVQ